MTLKFKARFSVFFLFFLLITGLCYFNTASASANLDDGSKLMAEDTDSSSNDGALSLYGIIDDAGLLNDAQTEELKEKCRTASEKNNIGIYILTVNELSGTRKSYIEDFYDAYVYEAAPDAAILLINMDPSERGLEIQGYGECEFNLSDDRIENILDQLVPPLQSEEYEKAIGLFIEQADYYMGITPSTRDQHTQEDNDNYSEDYYEEGKKNGFLGKTLRNLFIGIAAGAITVGVMAYHSGGRVTTNQGTYLSEGESRILGRWDRYIRTTTTRRPKPKPASSGGSSGGGGGVSSGGHSHSGGGRSF